jgi:hypothetical protein
VNPYNVHPKHIKVLKHFVYIQYGCGIHSKRGCSLNHFMTSSQRPNRALFFLKIHCHPHMYCSILVHPNAHPQHIKVPKHFVYIWYGYELLFTEVWSLYNNIKTSYRLSPAQIFQK